MALRPSQALLRILQASEEGRLGNKKARSLLSAKCGKAVSLEDYEKYKEQLLTSGTIKKGRGRGGSIELVQLELYNSKGKENNLQLNEQEQLHHLHISVRSVPGLRVKKHRKSITFLCGNDSDKLSCGWNRSQSTFFIRYRIESNKKDYSQLVKDLFTKAKEGIPKSNIIKRKSDIVLHVGENVAQANRVIRRLYNLLEDVSLKNAPAKVGLARKPRAENYYTDIASLIKHCIDNDLRWPLKNWRKAFGFDDVDELIVLGHSPNGFISNNPWREHVVPVCLIKDQAIKMAEQGASVNVIADFIRHHLYIVHITNDERKQLDSNKQEGGYNLKTSMPEDWIFGCNPLERLTAAGIEIKYDKQTSLTNWKPWKQRRRDKVREYIAQQFSREDDD